METTNVSLLTAAGRTVAIGTLDFISIQRSGGMRVGTYALVCDSYNMHALLHKEKNE